MSETTIGLRQAPSPPPQPAAPARCPGPQPRPAERAHPQPLTPTPLTAKLEGEPEVRAPFFGCQFWFFLLKFQEFRFRFGHNLMLFNSGLPGLWVLKQRAARFVVPQQPGFICGLPENVRS